MADPLRSLPERKTCMPCRKRKVRCDGRPPKCGPCSTAKRELDCVFPMRPESRDKRNALPKGKACLSCRGKKKKCDGVRPICGTCSRSRDGLPCIYDESNASSHPNSEGEADEESPVQSPYGLPSRPSQRDPSSVSPPQISTPPSPDSTGRSTSPSPFPSSVTSSPPNLPLLRALDERQLTYFRALAFSNSLRLGICFTPRRERAIREGDLSGLIVHPWFTWFVAVMGVHLHQESRHQWGELRLHATIAQTLLKMVLGMQATASPSDVLLAFYCMAMSCTYTHTLVPARRYLVRCQELIRSGGFGLVDQTWIDASSRTSKSAAIVDCPPAYTEEKHEMVACLLNLMYQQCMHCMMYDECHDLYADLEAQLPEFARTYPEVWEYSSIVVRIRTVLLVRDAFLHIGTLKRKPDISQRSWLEKARDLMPKLTELLHVIGSALNNTGVMLQDDPDDQRQTYLLMSSCKLFCMTAQARIYMETSKLPIVPKDQKGTFRDLAKGSVEAFLQTYQTFDEGKDLRYLDYFISVCWLEIRELYLGLYPGNLEWYPFTEVSRQIILLDNTLRVTPAGKGMSVVHSLVNIESGDRPPDEPNLLREEDRLKYGL